MRKGGADNPRTFRSSFSSCSRVQCHIGRHDVLAPGNCKYPLTESVPPTPSYPIIPPWKQGREARQREQTLRILLHFSLESVRRAGSTLLPAHSPHSCIRTQPCYTRRLHARRSQGDKCPDRELQLPRGRCPSSSSFIGAIIRISRALIRLHDLPASPFPRRISALGAPDEAHDTSFGPPSLLFSPPSCCALFADVHLAHLHNLCMLWNATRRSAL